MRLTHLLLLVPLFLTTAVPPRDASANECAASLVAEARGSLGLLREGLPDVRKLTKRGSRIDALLQTAQAAAGEDRIRPAKRSLGNARALLRSLRARLVKLGVSGKVEGTLALQLVARADALVVRLGEIRDGLSSGGLVCTTTTTTVTTSSTAPSPVSTSTTATGITSTSTTSTTTTATSSTTSTTLGGLNFSLPPNYGSTSLTSGFVPDPFTVGVTAGGAISVGYLGGGCVGFATSAPDFSVNYTQGAFPTLRFYFVGPGDSTLIVNAPSGSFFCSDDSFGTLNPTIDFASPSSGRYDVWVGSFASGAFVAGTLYVTENAINHP
jgi:hypothetical protein